MNIADFSRICLLNTAETSALEHILQDEKIFAMAEVISEKCFKNGQNPELVCFPENEKLAQAWFAAAYLSIDYSWGQFQKANFPRSVWLDTMTDMAVWLRNEERNSGLIGLGAVARLWTVFLYNAKVIRRGRLECNTEYYYKEKDLFDGSGNLLLAHGDPVINLHIPEDGPMTIDLCSESLKAIADFFAVYRKDFAWKGMICQSWLLDSSLENMLPATSNIIKFQKLGIHYPIDEFSDAVFRIFGKKDPFSIKDPTLLQRKAAEFLRGGGVFREEGMFISRSNLENINFDLEKLLAKNC